LPARRVGEPVFNVNIGLGWWQFRIAKVAEPKELLRAAPTGLSDYLLLTFFEIERGEGGRKRAGWALIFWGVITFLDTGMG
jgi:hypothetical protein